MPRLIRCRECALLQEATPIPIGARARCGRCGGMLFARKADPVARPLALFTAALVFWYAANAFPFMTLDIQGRTQPSHLASGVFRLYQDDLWQLALLVLLFVIVFPLFKVLGNLAVLVPLHFGRRPPYLRRIFRWIDALHPWSMTEVFLLGVIVAYAKLVDLATISVGPALIAFVGLIVAIAAADAALDAAEIWERIEPAPPTPRAPAGATLVDCHACGLLAPVPLANAHQGPPCARCGASLHRRKKNSLTRCWALVIAAFILYIPANLYPVMTVISFGRGAPSTILGGVVELVGANMWPLALLVFFASITVPMLKLLGLVSLLISVQRRSRWRTRERTLLYRIVEAVGRWSMLDIFMLSILVALVRLGSIATIEPGTGALSFAAVVVLTMFAAMSFDPRVLWDAAGANPHDR